ncbi:MAG: segregation ATPase FtsK/SpoIIIE, family, partial [Gaiellaceae bacterium]|nr:segregation ATPase FtsK/SpoIIIE, family [Gaiellaceae bacterium]
MARKKRPHKTSPKTPARVKKRRGKKRAKARAHHHPELVGLGLIALGIFLAAILWFGFNGGPVAHLVERTIGDAAYLMPLVLIPVGALIVAKSALVEVRPFRLGLAVALAGLMLTLGTGHGGLAGRGLESLVALALGTTGATILGVLLTTAGVLFLTGASLGAILRRTGHVVQRAQKRVRRPRRPSLVRSSTQVHDFEPPAPPPVDVKHDYPDLVSDPAAAQPPALYRPEP